MQVLKLLEAETGKKIHQLFDYICGVSTGAKHQHSTQKKTFTCYYCYHRHNNHNFSLWLLHAAGAVLAFMLGLAHFSLEECAEMYRRFGAEVFRQNRLVGTMKMGWTHSYYDTEIWEAILQYASITIFSFF